MLICLLFFAAARANLSQSTLQLPKLSKSTIFVFLSLPNFTLLWFVVCVGRHWCLKDERVRVCTFLNLFLFASSLCVCVCVNWMAQLVVIKDVHRSCVDPGGVVFVVSSLESVFFPNLFRPLYFHHHYYRRTLWPSRDHHLMPLVTCCATGLWFSWGICCCCPIII